MFYCIVRWTVVVECGQSLFRSRKSGSCVTAYLDEFQL